MRAEPSQIDVALRREADQLLFGKGLHALLAGYGRVEVVGSYAFRLMTWRDLDICLVVEPLAVPTFFELGRRVADILTPWRMSFRNERIAKTEGLPDGLYWGVYFGDEREAAWKIDIWAISPTEYERLSEYATNIAVRLSESARASILEIKSQCWMKPAYRRAYTSGDIYQAVLDAGVKSLSEFDAYLVRTKGCHIEA